MSASETPGANSPASLPKPGDRFLVEAVVSEDTGQCWGGVEVKVAGYHALVPQADLLPLKMAAAAPALYEALDKDAARLLRIREKLAGWDAMSGTQRADFMNWIWHAECEARAALLTATQPGDVS
jgi:hypothetical protein